ncbi:cation transporter [Alkalimarinus alittae]|uniref:Cation diffusion facilitator family transporter n=1 Tax=Alkalimarinus alittae TaxID=2961619 RepID=A0ABY6MXL3_9ALTE|nr:cation diffusion facilitator family transporter [Alkalimarinus alittae]UZE94532.1 cation diffusion facilitator family transporter [Alkalimarinus alittae]
MTDKCCGGCQSQNPPDEESYTPDLTELSQDISHISEFTVPKMDCPAEENMIRIALEPIQPTVILDFDTPNRYLKVYHSDNLQEVESRLASLGLGARLNSTRLTKEDELSRASISAIEADASESRVLKQLLAINAVMFLIEIVVGWWAQSTGLIADSLDMFADAAVYGVALYAVGHSIRMKVRAAHFAGWLQLILAFGALFEVGRRFLYASEPVSTLMIGFGVVALVANTACLLLIAKKKDSGAHMKASWIFSANDVIANLGVILAGALVAFTGSRYPDLVIGLLIGLVVLNGARKILKLKHN